MRLLSHRVTQVSALGFLSFGAGVLVGRNFDWDSAAPVRVGRAAYTVLDIAILYNRNLYNTTLNENSAEYKQLRSETHKEGAQKLLVLCRLNKGVFVKVGQHIGALEYLVPTEYVNTMKVLHSQAPSSSLKEIQKILKKELQQDPSEVFSEFEPEPLGAASLAQVHKAKLRTGETVAVKVQHPYVLKNSSIDMKIMETLVNILGWAFPEFQFQWLVEESKKNLPKELDFKQEAKNVKKVQDMFGHLKWLKIPRVYDELSTSKVLTMEYVEGGQVNDLKYIRENKIDPFDVSDKLGLLYSEMIFRRGFVHSDPHPGNILVKRIEGSKGKAEIILLDHGLYAELSSKVRIEYSGLWLSILNYDKPGMKQHCAALGVGQLYDLFSCMVSGRTWDAINKGLVNNYSPESALEEKESFQETIPKVLTYIIQTLAQVNREILLILKTNDLLRGIEFTLNTQHRMRSYLVMSNFCVRSVYERKIQETKETWVKIRHFVTQQWTLFKLTLYYFYLNSRSFFNESIDV